jgi:hypothetical protein
VGRGSSGLCLENHSKDVLEHPEQNHRADVLHGGGN